MRIRQEIEELAIEICKRHSHAVIQELHIIRALQSKIGTSGSEVTTRMIDKELDKIPVTRNAILSMSEGAANALAMLETTDPAEVRNSVTEWYFRPLEENPTDENSAPGAPHDDNEHDPIPKAAPKPATPKAKTSGKAESLDDVLAELNSLIGLSKAKEQVNSLIALHSANTIRKKQGLPQIQVGLHLVFAGSPGTGKTTVARLIGRLYKAIGLLPGGQVVEVDRSDLVAGYVGHTALKTLEKINAADGGVLFIDEAYSLISDSGNNHGFGDEVISTLVKAMEDKRDTLAVVVAGYSEDMDNFIKTNAGLKSRFQTYINFDDYSVDELIEIFQLISSQSQVTCPDEVSAALRLYIEKLKPQGSDGNGRFARNLFEKMYLNLTKRTMASGSKSAEELSTFAVADIPELPREITDAANKPKFGFN